MTKPPSSSKLGRILAVLFLVVSLSCFFGVSRFSESSGIAYFITHYGPFHFLVGGTLAALFTIRSWKWWVVVNLISIVIWLNPILSRNSSRENPSPENSLVVLTYNIAHGWIDEANVLNLIRNSEADVICLQEASINMIIPMLELKIQEIFPDAQIVKSSYNMIISPKHRLSLVHEIDNPTKWGRKSFPEAILTKNGLKYRIIPVHLEPGWITYDKEFFKSIGYLETVARNRKKQAELLLDRVRKSPEPVVLAGDFNGPPYSEVIRTISKELNDCFLNLGGGFSNTLLAKIPYQRIDYVFASQSLRPISGEVLNVTYSDHKPLKVTLERPRPQ